MNEQSEVVAFLATPAAYATAPPSIDRLETHGAFVFLAGQDAYKIKRAVRYPYMDFSTSERRRTAIQREFEINRSIAPQIYLGVVAITRQPDGSLRIEGDGEPVEWAVHMRRFDQANLLSSITDRGALTPELSRRLADRVLESHRRAPHAAIPDADARILKILTDLADGLADADKALPPFRHETFRAEALACLERARAGLRSRGTAGFVARCHGDLHLNNIVLWQGEPTLFDAIEFDETLATIDTLYDLAFLLMDLDHRGHRSAANTVFNRYLARSGERLDVEGLSALPLFLGLRCAVRGLVTMERGLLQPMQAPQRARDLGAARSSLDDAMLYLSPPAPRLVAVGGLSGTGKSTLAAALAPSLDPAPGALHIRTDVERKRHFGVAETERLPAECYTRAASDLIYRAVTEKARLALAAGHSVIVDAVFADPVERDTIAAVAKERGAAFTGLWLSAPRDVLLARVAGRRNDASDATPDVVELQLRRDNKPIDWHTIDAGVSAETTLMAALSRLGVAHRSR